MNHQTPMPRWTTLEQLSAERRKAQERASRGEQAMTKEQYREHLAVVLHPEFGKRKDAA